MNSSGDAAEQVVRLSLEGTEVALRLTGSAAKNILVVHPLYDNKTESALPEFIHQNVLPLYRINISRQVGEHIIIDSRGLHSQKSGNHQQERQNQNRRSQFNNYFTELFHFFV